MTKLLLDFDDLHPRKPENCLDSIKYLVDKIPEIKLLFFTIPKLEGIPLYLYPEWCREIRRFIDAGNVQLAVHGLCHSTLEFQNINYTDAFNKIQEAENIFTRSNLPFVKIFKGPHWGLNSNAVEALKNLNYKAIFSHQDFKHLEVGGIEFKYYNWNLKDPFPEHLHYPDSIILGHGHTHSVCDNGILETRDKIRDSIDYYNLETVFP